ncbi:S10 family peptidase [Acetobacter sp. AAB5]|uniref:S10 family peptidase n=1 Tax=Acetobacter sp. AAB5 TaxID=3418370 RepID=UPI003CEFB95F
MRIVMKPVFYPAKWPNFNKLKLAGSLAVALSLSTTAIAATEPSPPPAKPAPPVTGPAPAQIQTDTFHNAAALLPQDAITHHTGIFDKRKISYTAHTGTLTLRDDDGAPTARVFYVAYTQDGVDPAHRPVAYFFNGGPGAGTAYLHLGAAGPSILSFPNGNPADGANAQLIPNTESWLAAADLVFIDAPGTGWSIPTDTKKAAKTFYGVKQDAHAFAKAIQLWAQSNNRQISPRYLVGESYGGLRAIEVADALAQDQNILVNGIIMISPALDMTLLDTANDILATSFVLPSLEASQLALQHKLTPENAAGHLDSAYHYAIGPYLSTLANAPLAGNAAQDFYEDVATHSGIPLETVAKERGMLQPEAHDVRSRNGRLYSLYDGTFSIADPFPEGVENGASPDPILDGFTRAYGSAFEQYAATSLNFRTSLSYSLLNMKVNEVWDYRDGGSPIVRPIPTLRRLLALNPTLRVFIANGYYDLVCPFASSRWVAEHIPVGRNRIALHTYPGGHMIYIRADSRAALAQDAKTFMTP